MIKTFIAGAVLGYFGKKLYDEGKLQPYVDRLSETLNVQGGSDSEKPTKTAAAAAS